MPVRPSVRRSMDRHPNAQQSAAPARKLAARRAVLRAAALVAIDQLEARQLFAVFNGAFSTITGGGFTAQGQPLSNTYTYFDNNDHDIRMTVWGDITAQAIFCHDGNLAPTSFPIPPSPPGSTPFEGNDLFNIYVARADPRSSIVVTEFDPVTGLATPFTGDQVFGINLTGAAVHRPVPFVTQAGADGAVVLGGRSAGAVATAFTQLPLTTQLGVRPVSPGGTVDAGFTTAPGVSLNRVVIAGTVMGRVDVEGNLQTFYAGRLLTGDITGLSAGSQPATEFQHNFNVSGNLDNLVVNGSIGIDTFATSTVGAADYKTGFRMSIGGHLGMVRTGGSFYGSGTVAADPTINGSGVAQQELESTGDFEGNSTDLLGNSGVPSLAGSAAVTNNTAATAQLLATRFSSKLGHKTIQVMGQVDSPAGDGVDYYGIPLLAGQTVTATLTALQIPGTTTNTTTPQFTTAGELALGIFSPETVSAPNTGLLESSYHHGSTIREGNQPLTFTATEPGVYYLAVGLPGDSTFAGGGGSVPYELDITGVKDIGMGGILAAENISFPGGTGGVSQTGQVIAANTFPSLTVENGDMGALLAGGSIVAGDGAQPQSMNVAHGSFRVLQAADIGVAGGSSSPVLNVSGNVGLMRTSDGGGTLGVNIDPNDRSGLDIGPAIGGNYQLIDCAGTFTSNLIANAGIGTLRTASVGSYTDQFGIARAPTWHVNADNKGSDGIIDLIDCTGTSFGTLQSGGPKILTGPGGNVRYMRVAPITVVYNDDFFGGEQDQDISYPAGQNVAITDDSGTSFTLHPFAARNSIPGDLTQVPTATSTASSTSTSTSTSTGSNTSSSSATSTLVTDLSAGSINVLSYGIEDKGGVVVMDVTALPGNVTVRDTSISTATSTASSTSSSTSSATSSATATSTSTSTASNTGTTTIGAGGGGLTVTTSARAAGSSAEIGQIDVVGNGTNYTFNAGTAGVVDATTGALTTAPINRGIYQSTTTANMPMAVAFSGKNVIDCYDLNVVTSQLFASGNSGTGASTAPLAGATSIENQTAGEIVNVHVASAGIIAAQDLGFAKSHTGAAVSGATVYNNAFPYFNLRTVIQVGGSLLPDGISGDASAGAAGAVQLISSRGAIGNVLVNGTIGDVEANNDKTPTKGQMDGIIGTIYAVGAAGDDTSGNILKVNIGQGLASSGSGSFAKAGLFAENYIGEVDNQGLGSDIHGYIVAIGGAGGLLGSGLFSPTTGQPLASSGFTGNYINNINLTDGAIIGSIIETPTTLPQATELPFANPFLITPNTTGSATISQYGLGNVNLTGRGGIIDSDIEAGGIANINVKKGFGIFGSLIEGLSSDVLNTISVDGYGIRGTYILGDMNIGSISVNGNGTELPVTAYTPSVRQSETGAKFDAFTGNHLDDLNDLDLYLGVRKAKPKKIGSTEAGMIVDSTINGISSLRNLTAYAINSTAKTLKPLLTLNDPLSQWAIPTNFHFSVSMDSVKIKQNIQHAEFVTGGSNAFSFGGTMASSRMSIAGDVKSLTGGSFSGSAHINVTGPDGFIDSLVSRFNYNAITAATAGIGSVMIDGDLGSTNFSTSGDLDILYVKGNVVKGANVKVAKTLQSLVVRKNVLAGSTITARKINEQSIVGVVNGRIIVA